MCCQIVLLFRRYGEFELPLKGGFSNYYTFFFCIRELSSFSTPFTKFCIIVSGLWSVCHSISWKYHLFSWWLYNLQLCFNLTWFLPSDQRVTRLSKWLGNLLGRTIRHKAKNVFINYKLHFFLLIILLKNNNIHKLHIFKLFNLISCNIKDISIYFQTNYHNQDSKSLPKVSYLILIPSTFVSTSYFHLQATTNLLLSLYTSLNFLDYYINGIIQHIIFCVFHSAQLF